MEATAHPLRSKVIVRDDGTKEIQFESDDPDIESWLLELFDIEAQARAIRAAELSTSFQSFFEILAEGGLHSSFIPDARTALLSAWRFELGMASATYERARLAAEARRGRREITDDEIRRIADATNGTFADKLKAVCAHYPVQRKGDGRDEQTIRRRMTAELGYVPGGPQARPPRRNCKSCGKSFQPTIKGNETRCRLHRHDHGLSAHSDHS